MTKLPTDIDRMLWEIAESHDSKAIDDFGQRFPHLRVELGKRLRLVQTLKTARSKVSNQIPKFKRNEKRLRLVPVGTFFAWAAALLALAAGSYLITQLAMKHSGSSSSVSSTSVNSNLSGGYSTSNPDADFSTIHDKSKSDLPPNGSGTPSTSSDSSSPQLNPKGSNGVIEPNESVVQNPISIRLHDVPLQTAINAVAISGHFTVKFAPGMPNPRVDMDYTNSGALNILKDLGQTFSFTPERESVHNYLLIPTRDKSESSANQVNGGAYLSNP